jgi:hypothetical protein
MGKPLRDFDSADIAYRVRSFMWSLTGAIIGALIGFFYAHENGIAPGRPMLVGALVLWAFMYFGTLMFAERAGRWGSAIYFSGGSRLPQRRDYSLGDSLVARAQYDDALAEYRAEAARYADDPEPCLRIARLLRDEMHRPADALPWFRQALDRTAADRSIGLRREVVELYVHRLGTPRKALPELARIARDHAGTPHGEWADRELRAIREVPQSE